MPKAKDRRRLNQCVMTARAGPNKQPHESWRGKSAYSAEADHATYADHESLYYNEMPVLLTLGNEEARDDKHKRPAEHRHAEDASVEEAALTANG